MKKKIHKVSEIRKLIFQIGDFKNKIIVIDFVQNKKEKVTGVTLVVFADETSMLHALLQNVDS